MHVAAGVDAVAAAGATVKQTPGHKAVRFAVDGQ